MIINDLLTIFYWGLLISFLGLIFLPATSLVFKPFKDKGYGLAKTIGIILISFLTWWLASIHLLRFSVLGIYVILVVSWLVNLFILKKIKKEFLKTFKNSWKIWLVEELIFWLGLVGFGLIRGFQPDIIGLEKYMDFGFVNSILRSDYFPPRDIWWQGGTINYYYFGHLITAVLTRLSGIDSSITYNLMIATLLGLSLSGAFSLGGNLWLIDKKRLKIKAFIMGGLLASLIINLASNLHPLIYIWQGINKYWYPDATRFIPKTIHEFPFYTFTVADLHGHLNNLPNAVLMMGLIILIWLEIKNKKLNFGRLTGLLIFSSVFWAAAYMTNAWDYIIYLVTAFWIWLIQLAHNRSLKPFLIQLGSILATLLGLSLIFSLSFHLNFKSFASGLKIAQESSELWRLLVLWGWQLLVSLSFLLVWFFKFRRKKIKPTTRLIFSLMIPAWGLVVSPEFVYLRDIYATHPRANTMFKMVFAAWVIFGFLISLIVSWLKENLTGWLKKIWLIIFSLILVGCLSYPVWSIRSYYNRLKNYQGLNGNQYLAESVPDDWQGILWLKNNVEDQPVILEAVGESYTDYARVSVHAGLPTVVGWRVHEWLWRGSFDPVGKRSEEVKTIYLTDNLDLAKNLLEKYQVKYIFIGSLEYESYPDLNEAKFNQLGKLVFISHQTKIYQLD